jgi:hypothetical protein
VRIVIEFDAADGRATVTTEPPEGAGPSPARAPGTLGVVEATDAGPPADGTPLTGQAAAASGGAAVDAGPAPSAVGAGNVAGSEDGGAAAEDAEHT